MSKEAVDARPHISVIAMTCVLHERRRANNRREAVVGPRYFSVHELG